jgi:hypothetical protein
LLVPLVTGAALSKDGYDQQLVLNRGFVQDVTKLPAPAARPPVAQNPIPPAALGADIDETASAEPPLPQDAPTAAPAPSGQTQATKGPAADPNVPGTQSSDQYLPVAPDGNIALEVTDLLYGEAEESLRKMFTGRTVANICLERAGQSLSW